jgi:hypothetical protein
VREGVAWWCLVLVPAILHMLPLWVPCPWCIMVGAWSLVWHPGHISAVPVILGPHPCSLSLSSPSSFSSGMAFVGHPQCPHHLVPFPTTVVGCGGRCGSGGGCHLITVSHCWVPQWCPVVVAWLSPSLHPLAPCKQLFTSAAAGLGAYCPVSVVLLLTTVLTVILIPSRHLPCDFMWSWPSLVSSSIP